MYPTIPNFTTREPRESIDSYGGRALIYVLTYGMPGLLDDEGLEQADRISTLAVSARDVSPGAIANLTAVRTLIARELSTRRAGSTVGAEFAALMTGGPRPKGGSKVPADRPDPVIAPNDGAAVKIPTMAEIVEAGREQSAGRRRSTAVPAFLASNNRAVALRRRHFLGREGRRLPA
jgi:hypothetical protein